MFSLALRSPHPFCHLIYLHLSSCCFPFHLAYMRHALQKVHLLQTLSLIYFSSFASSPCCETFIVFIIFCFCFVFYFFSKSYLFLFFIFFNVHSPRVIFHLVDARWENSSVYGLSHLFYFLTEVLSLYASPPSGERH